MTHATLLWSIWQGLLAHRSGTYVWGACTFRLSRRSPRLPVAHSQPGTISPLKPYDGHWGNLTRSRDERGQRKWTYKSRK
jgi:hypothetical protein